eukprot:TRINITY_DN2206_c0_g1_i1.p1 TRINITY_DN2206_c0_g1~~TRINITY_DN2206_c0_g1_i1.p1  ORF type:complete len:424 (+),score=75.21 TRINITY_DN2206_c0_g1_i1:829-2100(+)
MGTCFMHPLYLELDKLLKKYDAGTEFAPGDQNTGDRDIFVDEAHLSPNHKPLSREAYIFGYAEKTGLPHNFWGVPDLLVKGIVFNHIKRYTKIHRELFGKYDYTLPPKPTPKLMQKMNMTLGQFLKQYDCEALIPLFKIGQCAQGYGLLETLPAIYGLWWFTPELFKSYLPPPVGKNPRGTPLLTMIKEGYSHVWETICKADKLKVVLGCEVKSIDRSKDIVTVEFEKNGKTESREFDYLIITTPLKESLKLLKSPTTDETTIFSSLDHCSLVTTLYESDPQPLSTQCIEYHPDMLHPGCPGFVYAQRHSQRCIDPANTSKDKDVWVAYQYLDRGVSMSSDELTKIFNKQMTSRGIKNIKVLEQKFWPYFWHFSQEDIQKEYPWKILDMQGLNKTLYSGSSACFESVNDVLNYNIMLANRFMV